MERRYTSIEMQQFWVGLIDSDGSVQCNHWRKKYMQYRIVIKMQINNLEMLESIREHLGGSVRVLKTNECVWVEDHQRRIWKLCSIFDRFPPLTTRVRCQIAFMKECILRKNVLWYLKNRENKYVHRDVVAKEITAKKITSLHYFPLWCSGFITGEGCFCIKSLSQDGKKGVKSFSIAQKHDLYLIESIREYFSGINPVRKLKSEMYLWKVYRCEVLENVIAHCDRYPLLGKKRMQFDLFKEK